MAEMAVAMRERYQSMIMHRFRPLISEAESLMQPVKENLEHQVKNEWGIYELEAEIAALELQVQELKKKKDARLGRTKWSDNNKAVTEEVERRLADQNGILSQLNDTRQDAIDAVWLAGAPDVVTQILGELAKSLATMTEDVKKFKITAKEKGLLEEPKLPKPKRKKR